MDREYVNAGPFSFVSSPRRCATLQWECVRVMVRKIGLRVRIRLMNTEFNVLNNYCFPNLG